MKKLIGKMGLWLMAIIIICLIPLNVITSVNIKLGEDIDGSCQIFYYISETEIKSVTLNVMSGQSVNVPIYLNVDKINTLRFDPMTSEEPVVFEKLSFKFLWKTVFEISADDLNEHFFPANDIATMEMEEDQLVIESNGNDPYITIKPESFTSIKISLMQSLNAYVKLLKLSIIMIFSACYIFYFIFKRLNTKYENQMHIFLTTHEGQLWLGFFLVMLITLSAIIYYDFITGYKMYVYNDIANDSFTQTLPGALNHAYNISEYGRLTKWNSTIFLGQTQSNIVNPINMWIYIFGKDNVPYLMGIVQVIKVLLSGIFYWLFARKRGKTYFSSSVVALFYAFSGHMIVRGSWESYPGEVLAVAILLYLYEIFFQNRKKWYMVSFAIAILGLISGSYSIILYLGITIGYSVFKYILEENKIKPSSFFKYEATVLGSLLVGFFLVAFAVVPGIRDLILSPRTESAILQSSTSSNISPLSFASTKLLLTAFFRTFSNDILGVSSYAGVNNYLEDPTFYCGILSILILPLCVIVKKGKARICYIISLGISFIYVFWTYIRYVANGFSKDTFKLSSFWIIVLLLYCAGDCLDELRNIKVKKIYYLILCGWTFILIIPFIYCITTDEMSLILSKCFEVILCMLIYLLLLYFYCIKGKQMILLFYFMVGTEIVLNSYSSVNNRVTVNLEEIKANYDNEVTDALSYLEEIDSTYYRIDYPTYDLCQSMAQGFMGTRAYVGGTTYSSEMLDFISSIGNNNSDRIGTTRYIYGFSGMNEINTFLGVKYLIYSNLDNWESRYVPFGYERIDVPFDNVIIYRNKYYLPLAFVYDEVISTEDFYNLEKTDRRIQLLETMVLEDTVIKEEGFLSKKIEDEDSINELQRKNILASIEGCFELNINNCYIEIPIEETDMPYLLLEMQINAEAREYGFMDFQIEWSYDGESYIEGNSMRYTTRYGDEDIELTLENAEKIKSIRIKYNSTRNAQFKDICIYGVNEQYFERYTKAIEERRQNITIEKFEEDYIALQAKDIVGDYMFFSIPYDKNWTAYVDGNKTEIYKANIGFMAAKIDQGDHEIELIYQNKLQDVFLCVSLITIGILIFYIMVTPKLKIRKH